MSTLKPYGMDFSENGDYPAVVEVVLGNGYRYRSAATDDEARKVIKQLSAMALAEAMAHPEREA